MSLAVAAAVIIVDTSVAVAVGPGVAVPAEVAIVIALIPDVAPVVAYCWSRSCFVFVPTLPIWISFGAGVSRGPKGVERRPKGLRKGVERGPSQGKDFISPVPVAVCVFLLLSS